MAEEENEDRAPGVMVIELDAIERFERAVDRHDEPADGEEAQ